MQLKTALSFYCVTLRKKDLIQFMNLINELVEEDTPISINEKVNKKKEEEHHYRCFQAQ